ncbi:MAG: flagellar hook-length control protein FliK, partial [Gammaproteobacteria bacterium]|nr:flagellar hook-length control protein FliK [Gammaproteobacteria bacterium]
AAQSLQGLGLSLQGQQGTVQPSQNSGSTLIPPASAAAMTAASTEDNSSASSFVSESGDTLTDTELQAQRLHSSREKLEFGQDRREWGGALGARIMTMVAEDVQKARIQLDPPELGSLEIKLHVSQDQASVQVQAQHAHVREVLEANAHRLRDALAAQGITLNGFDVSERGQGNEGSGQSGDGQGAQGGDDWLAEDGVVDDKPQVSSNNLLDTFA